MPEYLAPGVYVEEVDTGSKPIEGVSTSTAGMLGVTERGPVNVPKLITSFGEYQRWFGGYLRKRDFSNANGRHCFLPYAVEGFFTNGGKRVYVVRVLEPTASNADTVLFDPNVVPTFSTWLLSRATEGSPDIPISSDGALGPGSWIRIDSGSDTEYREVQAVAALTNYVPLRLPLAWSYDPANPALRVEHHTAPALVSTIDLDVATQPGDTRITVVNTTGVAIPAGTLLGLGSAANQDDEYLVTTTEITVATTPQSVSLGAPVTFTHAAPTPLPNSAVQEYGVIPLIAIPDPHSTRISIANPVRAGDTAVYVDDSTNFGTAGDFVRITDGTHTEWRLIGRLGSIVLGVNTYAEYPTTAVVDQVFLADIVGPPRNLTTAVSAGDTIIHVDDRQALDLATTPRIILRIGTANPEYIEILDIPEPRATAGNPDPGAIVLKAAVQQDFVAGTQVQEQNHALAAPSRNVSALAVPAQRNGGELLLSNVGALATLAPTDTIQIQTAPGVFYYHGVTGPADALTPLVVTLMNPLGSSHAAGAAIVARAPMLEVEALDPGGWGNRLRVRVEDSDPPVLRTTLRQVIDATHIRLLTSTGIEAGTVLEYSDPVGATTLTKVEVIDRQNDFLITLASALPGAAAAGHAVHSREFDLTAELMAQPNPAVPTRDETVLISETFRQLTLDHRHSHYIEKIIGATWTPGNTDDDGVDPMPLRRADRRSEGASWLIRIDDLAVNAAATETLLRTGPEVLTIVSLSGTNSVAARTLNGGTDQVNLITDNTYIGTPHNEPENRTGLFSLRNEDEISIVACPGRTSRQMQGALISHCEFMRYRFAVLDGPEPPGDSINDVQFQRQQHDTKYAAFYHPWLLIPDPFPTNFAEIANYPISPSGHVVGVYARTDIERGVHKAPANEVVRGIIGLQRSLNKGEQDILNPSPVNINVIRDFRPNNRGIRVYGGRVITSDPDWKYVSVRRLLIFIEASIDRGLQWVTFEPNAEPLWARVRRSVSNFLTVVWRNGALEGTKPEEAFFVKSDRTTMTQTDIDNGRLICVIGVAPVKPAEYVIIRIGLWTANADE